MRRGECVGTLNPGRPSDSRTLGGKCGVLILWGRKAKTTEMVRTGHREVVQEEQVGLSQPHAQHHGERL